MEENELKELARQLRQPDGDFGKQVGKMMNEGNMFMNQFAIETLKLEPGDHLLEIGQGNGYYVKDILSANESIKYSGADFSQLMINESINNNHEWISQKRAEFFLTDASRLPFPDNTFSKIFTVNTLYFWDNPETILSEIKRVLKQNGYFFLVFRPKDAMKQLPFTKYGFKMYTEEDARKLLENNDLNVIDTIKKREPMQEGDEKWGIDEYAGTIIILKSSKKII